MRKQYIEREKDRSRWTIRKDKHKKESKRESWRERERERERERGVRKVCERERRVRKRRM